MRSGHKLVAKNIPQAAVGFVEAFLAVNFKYIARPGHGNVDDVLDLPWTVGHDHDPIRQRHGFHQVMGDENNGLVLLLPYL